jgi:hypothetical protein
MLTGDQAGLLRRHLFLGVPSPDSIRIRSVQDAVAAGSLLAYNPATRTLEETPLSLAAEELLDQARHYESVHRMVERHRWQLFEALRGRRPYALPYMQAVDIWSLHHAQTNFYRRAAALYAYLIGRKPDPQPEDLMPHSPFGAETDEQIKRERTSRTDVREWSDLTEFWKL